MNDRARSIERIIGQENPERLVEIFERLCERSIKVQHLDNRELLWLVVEFLIKDTGNYEIGGYQEALLNELEDRLYPEYDGDKVQRTEYGWATPDGPVIYNQAAYTKADTIRGPKSSERAKEQPK